MTHTDTIHIAEGAFSSIAQRFPSLQAVRDESSPVELCLRYPEQPGLKQTVCLNLQNHDELHFVVGHFWLEWFPCTEPAKVDKYVDAVCGYLSGKYRVLEHYRGGKCVKAELQEPVGETWKTIGRWSTLLGLLPFPTSTREVRNA